jgi:hypothetical protein
MTELRALAQSMGCKWAFADDRNALQQKIKLRQTDMLPKQELPKVPVPEDQRLRTKPPARVSDEDMVRTMLAPYIQLGLIITFDNGTFNMKYGPKTDSGTLRQPPRVILDCARRVMA